MEVKAKIRFNASKQSLEKFGTDKYLIYLPFAEDGSAQQIVASILSRQMGVPPARIKFKMLDYNKDWVFEIF